MDLTKFMNDFLHTEGFQSLTRDLGELFECPVMVIDVAFRVVSWHAPEKFPDIPFRKTVENGRLSYEISSVFLGGAASIAHGARYIELADSPYRRRFSPLRAGGIHVGYLILLDMHSRLEKVDPDIYSRIEAALGKQLLFRMSRDSHLFNTEEAVLLQLLEGRYANEPLFRLQAASAGLGHFSPSRIALLNLELYRSSDWSENTLRSVVMDRFPDCRPLIHGGNVILFLEAGPDLEALRQLGEKYSLRIVVSALMDNLFHLPGIYKTSLEILEYLLPLMPGPFTVEAEPYYGLMMTKRLSSRRDLILPAVRELARRDIDEESAFCLTLYTYLRCHHSLRETCERLYTHRNTVLYRIRKMKEEYSIPIDDPDRHAALLMSCALVLLRQDPKLLFP